MFKVGDVVRAKNPSIFWKAHCEHWAIPADGVYPVISVSNESVRISTPRPSGYIINPDFWEIASHRLVVKKGDCM